MQLPDRPRRLLEAFARHWLYPLLLAAVLGLAAGSRAAGWNLATVFAWMAGVRMALLLAAEFLVPARPEWRMTWRSFWRDLKYMAANGGFSYVLRFGVAWLARLSRQQSVTLGIETAIQNGTLAMVIGSSVLQNDAYALPGALYGVLMYVSGLAFAYGMRSVLSRDRAGAPATVPGAGTQ